MTTYLSQALDNDANLSVTFRSKQLPAGGAAREVLMKDSAADFDRKWAALIADDIPDLTLAKITDSGDAAGKNVGTGSEDVAAGDAPANAITAHEETHPIPTTRDDRNEPAIGEKGTAFNKDFGTDADDVCEGNDSRLSDSRDPNQHDNTAHSTNYEPEIAVKGSAFNKDFGSNADTVTEGNDSRLSDAREPTAHTHTLTDVTDSGDAAGKNVGTGSNDVAAGNHGHTQLHDRKHSITDTDDHEFPEEAHGNEYLRKDGAFAVPVNTGDENVQSDWNQIDTGEDDFIKNKPTLGDAAAKNVGTGSGDVAVGDHGHTNLPTDDEKAALDGTGTPSGSNKYVTNDDGRLSDDRDPNAHTHGNITDDGKIGTSADLPVKTGTGGELEAGAFGTGSGQFAEGDHDHDSDYLGITATAADSSKFNDRTPAQISSDVRSDIEFGDLPTGTGSTEVAVGDHSHTELHEHTNKSTLDKITEDGGDPLWDGGDWPGAPQGVLYGSELSGASITLTRANHCFKTTLFNDATDRNLELQHADWEEGDWMVIVPFGDGQGTITPEGGNVKLPDWDKTAGKGFKMYIECYNVDGSDRYFSITGGVE